MSEPKETTTEGAEEIRRGAHANPTARFVRVGTAEDPFEADLLADALEEAGIDVLARARRDAPVDTLVMPASPWWELLVPEPDAERAAKIVAERHEELAARADEAAAAAEAEERDTEGDATVY